MNRMKNHQRTVENFVCHEPCDTLTDESLFGFLFLFLLLALSLGNGDTFCPNRKNFRCTMWIPFCNPLSSFRPSFWRDNRAERVHRIPPGPDDCRNRLPSCRFWSLGRKRSGRLSCWHISRSSTCYQHKEITFWRACSAHIGRRTVASTGLKQKETGVWNATDTWLTSRQWISKQGKVEPIYAVWFGDYVYFCLLIGCDYLLSKRQKQSTCQFGSCLQRDRHSWGHSSKKPFCFKWWVWVSLCVVGQNTGSCCSNIQSCKVLSREIYRLHKGVVLLRLVVVTCI